MSGDRVPAVGRIGGDGHGQQRLERAASAGHLVEAAATRGCSRTGRQSVGEVDDLPRPSAGKAIVRVADLGAEHIGARLDVRRVGDELAMRVHDRTIGLLNAECAGGW